MDFREIVLQCRLESYGSGSGQWRVVVNTEINVCKSQGVYWLSERTLSFSRWTVL